jgi:hypothetical protein
MSRLVLKETTPPPTPENGKIAIYAKTDGYIYAKDDTGREVLISNTDTALLDHIIADDPHPQYLKERTSRKIEYIKLDATHIQNKKIVLDKTPINPQFVQVDIKEGGGPLFFGEDFIVEGNELKWDGLEYDFIAEPDDFLRIIYDHN